jgi:neutral ceramidase
MMALVGAYIADITPKETVDLNGYIRRFGKSQGIHDPLSANFIYIESKGKKALIISLDILTISFETANKLINAISDRLNIEKNAIILAAIHTHSAVGAPYLRNVGEENENWLKDFEEKIINGSESAYNKKVECELYSYEAYSNVGINRRNPVRGIDPNAPFFVAKKSEKIIAWVVNYNCHAVCLTEKNLLISADFVHYMRNYLYEKLDQRFPVLFLNGGSGDVDPKMRGSFDEAKYTGQKLAEELMLIYRVYKGEPLNINISCKKILMTIPYSWQPTIEEAEINLKNYTKKFEGSKSEEERKINGAFLIWAKDILEITKQHKLPQSVDIPISFISLGKVSFISFPLELFSSISMKLRRMFAESLLFVVSYGNGYTGYLADKAAAFEGGYEIEDWHKYAGILPKVPEVEDLLWKKLKEIQIGR